MGGMDILNGGVPVRLKYFAQRYYRKIVHATSVKLSLFFYRPLLYDWQMDQIKLLAH